MNAADAAVYKARLAATAEKLREARFDVLIVYARGSVAAFGSKSHGYMRHLCGWDTGHTAGVLTLGPDAAPTRFTSDVFLKKMAEETGSSEDVRFAPIPAMPAAVLKAVADVAAKTRERPPRIAYIGRSETPSPFMDELRAGLPDGASIHDFESALDMDVAIKDEGRIALHRAAAVICDDAFAELDRLATTRIPAYRLQSAMEKTTRDAGAEHSLIWLSVAPAVGYCRFLHEAGQNAPQPGDQILCGIYVLHKGCWGHAVRMGVLGEPTKTMLDAYDVVRTIEDAAFDVLRPGNNLYDVNRLMEERFFRFFPEDTRRDVFRFRMAHGLGRFSEDPLTTNPFQHAYLTDDTVQEGSLEIKPGMLFELHPNFFRRNVVGAALGDMVLITPDGPEYMTRFPRDFTLWGGSA